MDEHSEIMDKFWGKGVVDIQDDWFDFAGTDLGEEVYLISDLALSSYGFFVLLMGINIE